MQLGRRVLLIYAAKVRFGSVPLLQTLSVWSSNNTLLRVSFQVEEGVFVALVVQVTLVGSQVTELDWWGQILIKFFGNFVGHDFFRSFRSFRLVIGLLTKQITSYLLNAITNIVGCEDFRQIELNGLWLLLGIATCIKFKLPAKTGGKASSKVMEIISYHSFAGLPTDQYCSKSDGIEPTVN